MTRRSGPIAAVAAALLTVAIAVVSAGCGGDAQAAPPAADPVAHAAPVPVEPVEPGGRLAATPDAPRPVATALKGGDVLVIAFVIPDAADDRLVARQLDAVRRHPAYRDGVSYFVYPVGPGSRFGDLADHLGVTGTPAVAVIARDRTLTNRWIGLVDETMLRQAINDASATAALGTIP